LNQNGLFGIFRLQDEHLSLIYQSSNRVEMTASDSGRRNIHISLSWVCFFVVAERAMKIWAMSDCSIAQLAKIGIVSEVLQREHGNETGSNRKLSKI